MKKKNKTELLSPAGSPEAFNAAMEAGADAVYLGLRQFNARGRARNFTPRQLGDICQIAHSRNAKVYLTLNTMLKNKELEEIVPVLRIAAQTPIDAVIVQDWALIALFRKFLPHILLHASTQMTFHNSMGAEYAANCGFQRIITARELTLSEIEAIARNKKVGTEVFIHGALCYSVSGQCLFSSYLGGMSANRGLCRQPCRRLYRTSESESMLFNLRDLQLLHMIPKLVKAGVQAFKIEGRMKPASYVYRVTRAYRMVLDDPGRIAEAEAILREDLGREKTVFFAGGSLRHAFSERSGTGLIVGSVLAVEDQGVRIRTNRTMQRGDRIRIESSTGKEQMTIKIEEVQSTESANEWILKMDTEGISPGSGVILSDTSEPRFSSKLEKVTNKPSPVSFSEKKVLNWIRSGGNRRGQSGSQRKQLYIRISDIGWLRKLYLPDLSGVIVPVGKDPEECARLMALFPDRFQKLLIPELPPFIAEQSLDRMRTIVRLFLRAGTRRYVIGHLSQTSLFDHPDRLDLIAGMHLPLFNHIAIRYASDWGVKTFIMPPEDELDNILRHPDRSLIIPLFYSPPLFFSRAPVMPEGSDEIEDDRNRYRITHSGGFTRVLPEKPVALFQFRERLQKFGFSRFLIDLEGIETKRSFLKTLLKHFHEGSAYSSGTTFNFKKGLT